MVVSSDFIRAWVIMRKFSVIKLHRLVELGGVGIPLRHALLSVSVRPETCTSYLNQLAKRA